MPPTVRIFSGAPQWKLPRSRFFWLYHGCTSVDAAHIVANGIDLGKCRIDTDFGRGLYTTTVRYQARQWAWARFLNPAIPRPKRAAVIRFRVDRYQLADLAVISFVLGGPSKKNFWSLVQHCRQSSAKAINDHGGPIILPDGTRWYDVACGPVAAFWQQRFAMQDADQFSFHTSHAIRVLQRLIDSGNKKLFDVEMFA